MMLRRRRHRKAFDMTAAGRTTDRAMTKLEARLGGWL
jgi:hypothetical protein